MLQEWSTVIRTISDTLPPPQLFKRGDRFLAKVLSAVSPLEFYVIKVAHIRSGCESNVDNDKLRQLEESDPRRTTRELAQDLGLLGGLRPVAVRQSVPMFRYAEVHRPVCTTSQYAPPLAHYCTLSDLSNKLSTRLLDCLGAWGSGDA
ncbi:unnamed protein product [Heligmosomoides polygyrus]|uniref:Tudor domain-containing protein n=1 Tax=Heligmosomoides polygyrus TaxID=6339 RepID=A0A183G853_HELPZ|nr:unnamed protein product [Heligmosomoides polygyrus]